MTRPKRPLDGYVRVSVVGGREGERFQSPKAQREAIERWATYRGVQLGETFEDLDKSGGTLKRPGLETILDRIRRGESGGIVVAKLDRLSRSVVDGLKVIEEIEQAGGQVVSTSDSIDTTTANGRLQLTMFLAIAQWYRDSVTEQWASTQDQAMARGALPGRTGYGTQRDDDGRVSLHPQRSALVARMVTERANGDGWKTIATRLSREQIPTPNGNGQWSASTVQGIVSSEGCIGVYRGPRNTRVEDAWSPMVSRRVWDAAQQVSGKRDAERKYQDRLLASIARCAGCRRTLKRTTNQQGHVSYGCVNRGCPGRSSIGAKVLDTYVRGLINARMDSINLTGDHQTDDEYTALLAARDEATSELERWRDDTGMRSIIGDHDYRAGLIVRVQARDQANEALAAQQRKARSGVELPEGEAHLEDMPWEQQRKVTEAFLHAVFVRQAKRRGPFAAKDAAERTLIQWSDDSDQRELPSPVSGELLPVAW